MGTFEELYIYQGSMLGRCHVVEDILGQGSFGFVTKCRNMETNQVEAIKVNKNQPHIIQQVQEEVLILEKLRRLDPDTCNIVRWNGLFFENDHICLIFEILDLSLRGYNHYRQYLPLSLYELRPIVYQLAIALFHLRSLGIIHADLKPDNIMVVDRHQQPLSIKVIDFGLAHDVSTTQPGNCFGTTWYRAPELILGMPYNEAIDIWSLGVTVAELVTGFPLYPGETNYDVLHFILQTQGQPDDYVLDCGIRTYHYFSRAQKGMSQWTFKTPDLYALETGVRAKDTRGLILFSLDGLRELMEDNWGYQNGQEHFMDLVKRMLLLDAILRITAEEVLQHPLFS